MLDDLARGGDEAHRDGLSWLVSTGHFPTEWLASVARANVVLPMLGRTLPPTDITLGTTSRFLGALANNPSAARAAVGGAGRDWTAQVPPSLPVFQGIPKPTVGGVLVAMSAYAGVTGAPPTRSDACWPRPPARTTRRTGPTARTPPGSPST
ncbi:hypothetical protein ACFQYP_61205 [Nonomuraea antimicrobica]